MWKRHIMKGHIGRVCDEIVYNLSWGPCYVVSPGTVQSRRATVCFCISPSLSFVACWFARSLSLPRARVRSFPFFTSITGLHFQDESLLFYSSRAFLDSLAHCLTGFTSLLSASSSSSSFFATSIFLNAEEWGGISGGGVIYCKRLCQQASSVVSPFLFKRLFPVALDARSYFALWETFSPATVANLFLHFPKGRCQFLARSWHGEQPSSRIQLT